SELARCSFGSEVGSVIERLVATPAHVEHDAHVQSIALGQHRGARGTDEQEADVGGEQYAEYEKNPLHRRTSRGGKEVKLGGLQRRAPPATCPGVRRTVHFHDDRSSPDALSRRG